MKNIRIVLSENFQFLEVKFSIYLNRRVFVMRKKRLFLPTLWILLPFYPKYLDRMPAQKAMTYHTLLLKEQVDQDLHWLPFSRAF